MRGAAARISLIVIPAKAESGAWRCAAAADFSPVIPAKAGIQRAADALDLSASAHCQNQDLQDYRIFRIRQARVFSTGARPSTLILAGFSVVARRAIGKRLVRIRIYGITGFSGFVRRASFRLARAHPH